MDVFLLRSRWVCWKIWNIITLTFDPAIASVNCGIEAETFGNLTTFASGVLQSSPSSASTAWWPIVPRYVATPMSDFSTFTPAGLQNV